MKQMSMKQTIIFIIVIAITSYLAVYFANHVLGQEVNMTQKAVEQIINMTDPNANDTGQELNFTESILKSFGDFNKITQVNKTNIDNVTMQLDQENAKKESLEPMVNYCFEHVDRPNPIQDLIDKGFVDSKYRNVTCKDFKMSFDWIQENITILQNEINEYWSSPEGRQQQQQEFELNHKFFCEQLNGTWDNGNCLR